ncbi:hypothetical protein [Roseateles sp. P5_E1]
MDSQASWRQDWEIDEKVNSVEVPVAWHRSGLCFQIEYDDILWIHGPADVSRSREKELILEMGESAFNAMKAELGRQLRQMWRERGYTDFSPQKSDARAPWRADWAMNVDESARAQAVHSSGLGLTIHPDIDMGCVPVWEATESPHYADESARLKREIGEDKYAEFLANRRHEALELWYGLGYGNGNALRPTSAPISASPCPSDAQAPYALWFELSPFSADTEPAARDVARKILDRHFGAANVVAAHQAALATGKRYVCESGAMPEAVRAWLAAIGEAYWAAWEAAGLPALTSELSHDNPQLDCSCVMVGPNGTPEAEQKPFGLHRRIFDVWIEASAFEPDDETSIADYAREALCTKFGSQEAVLEAKAACQAAGGIHAAEPQPDAVVAWRAAAREALAEAIELVTRFDDELAGRIRTHADFERCFIEVGSPRLMSSV